jgi:hypothetical protein
MTGLKQCICGCREDPMQACVASDTGIEEIKIFCLECDEEVRAINIREATRAWNEKMRRNKKFADVCK